MKFISLNYKNLNLKAIVDDSIYAKVAVYRWSKNTSGYACRTTRIGKRFKSIIMHRFILGVENSRIMVDHINGNRLDNRIENLRLCSNTENCRNAKLKTNSKTGYKGVDFLRGKFRARIRAKGKECYLGLFKTAKEAAEKYDEAAKKYFKEFAKLNFKS